MEIVQIVITKNGQGQIQIKLMGPTKVEDEYTPTSIDDAIDYVADCIHVLADS